jgi:hypothetical protein
MPRVAVLSLIAFASLSGNAKAQTTGGSASSGILDVKARVPPGEVVYVTDIDGITVRATLAGVSSDVIEIIVNGQMRNVAADQVRRVQWQPRDSPLTGALIGAGIGAIPGIYYLVADPNECAGMCPQEYALIGIGALVGGLVDWAVKEKVTVYERPTVSGIGRKLLIAPVITPNRRVVQVALRF